MKQKISVKQKIIHDGFVKLGCYEFTVPSYNPQVSTIHFKREVLSSHDSVLVLIYITSVDSFLFVQQFRPGVYLNANNNDDPFILECVAGLIDKELTPEKIACMEVYEEAGITINSLQLIAATYMTPGITTEKTHFYYAQVQDAPQCGLYGVEGEDIRTCLLKRKVVFKLMDEMKINDAATLLVLNWFRANKEKKPG